MSANLWLTLVERDRHCRFPGCDRPPSWCQAHHVWHWEHGGPTDRDNLVLLCSRHHHLIHRPRWRLELRPDATLEITNPWGQTILTEPPADPASLLGPLMAARA